MLTMQFKAADLELRAEKLVVEVFDYNSIAAHSFIGASTVDIAPLIEKVGEMTTLDFDINGKDKTEITGHVQLVIQLVVK